MNFYIADTHFGHKNALAFDDRKFLSIEEHDETIIRNWNDVVGYDDTVYMIGDVSWHNATKTNEILDRLNGHKVLIIGNHDGKLLRNADFRSRFMRIENYLEIEDDKRNIVLCHYPIPCFKNHFYGWYHLYGHVHDSFESNLMYRVKFEMVELYDKPCNMFNVFCKSLGYKPMTLDEILEVYNKVGGI